MDQNVLKFPSGPSIFMENFPTYASGNPPIILVYIQAVLSNKWVCLNIGVG